MYPVDAEIVPPPLPPPPPPPLPLGVYMSNEDSERLATVIKKALEKKESVQSPKLNGEDTEPGKKAQFISLRFNGAPQWHIVPWSLCSTWQDMENFIQLYFADNKTALEEVSEGKYDVVLSEVGIVAPSLWDYVIEPKSKIEIVLKSSYFPIFVPPPPPPPDTQEDKAQGTSIENRIWYTVSYLENIGISRNLVAKHRYEEPVEFEYDVPESRLPALEEIKTVECSVPDKGRNFENSGKGKKAKLGQLDRVTQTHLKIHSQYLLNLLRSIIEFSSHLQSGEGNSLSDGIFKSPYKDLYHHIGELEKHRHMSDSPFRLKHSDVYNKKCDQHIDLLLEYLRKQPSIPLNRFTTLWSRKTPSTTFACLWLLLKPGEDVYVKEADGSLNAYVLDGVYGGPEEDLLGRMVSNVLITTVWNLNFDGKVIVQRSKHVEIPIFDSEREIISLPIFPARFLDNLDGGKQKAKLIERGRKYFEYSKGPSFLEYTGAGLKRGRRSYKRARVVVEHASAPWWKDDFKGMEKEWNLTPGITVPLPPFGNTIRAPRCECEECALSPHYQETSPPLKFSDYKNIDPKKVGDKQLTDHQYLIMSSHMFAFILKDRAWDILNVFGLQDVDTSASAKSSIEMDPATREAVIAITKTYTEDGDNRFRADSIQGKGEGQIILLHGPPGTGKTYTAEFVAEFTKRPLLSITVADLGSKPEQVEKNLLQFFRDANDWEAIVLLDEADIYLEKRAPNDHARNSIVSIFLRALDYFQGILFLTTNRVGQFDEAFKSRLHISIGYNPLDDKARGMIWDALFRKLRQDYAYASPEDAFDYDAKGYVRSKEVMGLEWNGREIRNAFQTAVALAAHESKEESEKSGGKEYIGPKLKESHLRQVVEMSSKFKEYMKLTNEDMEDKDIALKDGNRFDDYHEKRKGK